MRGQNGSARRWVEWPAFGSTAASFASIAVSQILLGAGLAALAWRPRWIRIPRVAWPALALIVWTLVSAAASADPAAALPQIKKFFVFGMLPLAYSAFRTADASRRATEAWFVVAGCAALAGLAQFVTVAIQAWIAGSEPFGLYAGSRITGLFSHWMTFSQASALALVTLACYLMFGKRRPGSGVWLGVGTVIGIALVLSFTRSAWIALVACGVYLLAVTRPRLLVAVPVVLLAGYLAAPRAMQERVRSIRPDANQSRIVEWRTGLRMIAKHPLVGVGPERVGALFAEYQPEDVRELPTGFYGHLHNVYIHFAAERGIPATLIVVWLFAQIVFDMRRGLRGLPAGRDDHRYLLHAGIAGTLATAVMGCFDVSLGDSEVLAAFLGLAAVAYSALPERPGCSKAADAQDGFRPDDATYRPLEPS